MIYLSFKHLSLQEREFLFLWKAQGTSFREIARRLNRDHKTISLEFKRNTKYGKKYVPCLAQKRYVRVTKIQRSKAPLKDLQIYLYVREHLRSPFFWTPSMIAGRIPLDIKNASIDDETIYRYIYSNKAKKDHLWQYLPCARKKRRKFNGRKVNRKGKVPNSISIDLRPLSISKRKHPGHWETDNVESNRASKPALSVSVERSIRFVMISKLINQSALVKSQSLVDSFNNIPFQLRLSITQDNGKENYFHQLTASQINTKMYFCHAYHSWEKGSVENRNKIIRRFFPKGTDFSKVSIKQIQNVEFILNSMPLKCLKYKTPNEKMSELKRLYSS